MASITDVETQVRATTDVEQSAVLLLTQLHQMLLDAKSDPARLDSIISQLDASKQSLAEAILANTT